MDILATQENDSVWIVTLKRFISKVGIPGEKLPGPNGATLNAGW